MCYAEQAAPRTAVCEICGSTFTPRGNRKYTCSHACTVQRNRIEGAKHRCRDLVRIQATCVICGATFETTTTSKRKTCSHECTIVLKRHHADKAAYTRRVCPACGREYTCAKKRKNPLCQQCQARAEADRKISAAFAAAAKYRQGLQTRDCVICGAEFVTTEHSRIKTCSQECSRALRNRNKIAAQYMQRTCPVCGHEFRCPKKRKSLLCPECQTRKTPARQEAAAAAGRHYEPTTGTCVICGAEFEQNLCKSRKTCSPACSYELKQRTKHQCQYETRVCSVCGSEFDAAKACHASVCRPCRERHRAEVRGRKTAARAERKQCREPVARTVAAKKTAASPAQPASASAQSRPLTMAQRARMLRQAIAKSAFQQRARAEISAAQSSQNRPLFIPEPSGMNEFDAAQDW